MSILKEDLIRHLFWKKITPTHSDYYKEVQIAIFEFLNGYPYDPNEPSPKHLVDRVALEALKFTKTVKKNWKLSCHNKTEDQFVHKFNKPGGFLRNYVSVPGPYKREAVVPPKKKTTKNNRHKKRKSKRRPQKPFSERPRRTRNRHSKKVRDAAFGDLGTVLFTAANMATRGDHKDLGYVLKKMAQDFSLATQLKKELKTIRRRKEKGIGKLEMVHKLVFLKADI